MSPVESDAHPRAPETTVPCRRTATDACRQALLILGPAALEELSERTGLGLQALRDTLADEMAARMIEAVDGSWRLSRLGRLTQQAELRERYRIDVYRAQLETLYATFLDHNEAVKSCCTDWQLDVFGQRNTHDDFQRDRRTRGKLARINKEIGAGLTGICATDARFGIYRRRLNAAIDRLDAGDVDAMARPDGTSYHDVWMELHADLLASSGRERGAKDGH